VNLIFYLFEPEVTTDDPNDTFWLGQPFFVTHQYSRAKQPFSITLPTTNEPEPPLLNGHGPLSHLSSIHNSATNAKGKGKEVHPPISVPRLPMGARGMIEVLLGIYTPDTFPYQIRTDISFFNSLFYKFLTITSLSSLHV
jgi:hypothetical protein